MYCRLCYVLVRENMEQDVHDVSGYVEKTGVTCTKYPLYSKCNDSLLETCYADFEEPNFHDRYWYKRRMRGIVKLMAELVSTGTLSYKAFTKWTDNLVRN